MALVAVGILPSKVADSKSDADYVMPCLVALLATYTA